MPRGLAIAWTPKWYLNCDSQGAHFNSGGTIDKTLRADHREDPIRMQESNLGAFTKADPHYRWVICALLFVVTTVNYMDRNVLGVLKPTIQGDLHFSETDFGNIVFAFSMAYAAGYASMGAFSDKVGVRIGLAVAAMIWCAASAAHGLVTSVAGFTIARIALGL